MPDADRLASTSPLVDYLVLDDQPHLVVNACVGCVAKYFDRRNACASCGGTGPFERVPVPHEGVLKSFTIVSFAAPGIPVPFVAGVVDCGGTGTVVSDQVTTVAHIADR